MEGLGEKMLASPGKIFLISFRPSPKKSKIET
jgi:hypothetical protein